jgi:hypothetical protein
VSAASPQVRIPVGVVVERRKATSPWLDMVWRSVAVLGGSPDATPWTALSTSDRAAMFYVGAAEIELYRTEAEQYRSNLVSGAPLVWVALRRTGAEPPYHLFAVTVDPSEGESFTQAGDDLVDAVPMPAAVRQVVAEFVAEHYVEQPTYRRKRDPARPEAPTRGGPMQRNGQK